MNYFKRIFRGINNIISGRLRLFGNWMESKHNFSNTIFLNICDLLTDLTNDVEFFNKGSEPVLFAEFKFFFENCGQLVLNKLYNDGYVVIGHDAEGFRILYSDEYNTKSIGKSTIVIPIKENLEVYVMRSKTYIQQQASDRQLLKPFFEFLDNVLNGSNTVAARLGSVVIATPEQPKDNPISEVLDEQQREEIEKQISENYGSLSSQKQFLLLNRPMKTNVISLSQTDIRLIEKTKLAILAIADRIKVPANQIAIIDALSSRSFANGTELREGDFMKYQSFERLLQTTFVLFAKVMGLNVDYTIYNKPIRAAAPFANTQNSNK